MPTLSEKLLAQGLQPHPRSKAGVLIAQKGVCMSPELARILALPRRQFSGTAPDLTELYGKGVDNCGEDCRVCSDGPPGLRPVQSQMLWEADKRQGLFAMVAIGAGKTLASLLLHDALNATRTVLLVKASLREQLFQTDLAAYGRHFRLPPVFMAKTAQSFTKPGVYVLFYSELSKSDGEENLKTGERVSWLERINPDLVVADEAQVFRYKGSARSKRFFRYMKDRYEVRFCAMSGSMAKKSIRDFGPLIELALRKDSPVPSPHGRTLFEWSCALDANVEKPLPPGKLMLLCQPGEDHHEGFRRRLVESEGVVATQKGSIDTALELVAREPKMPAAVSEALAKLAELWRWEDEEISDALHYARLAKQLSQGFFLRWEWPDGIKDEEWLDARRAWHQEVREYLTYHSTPGMDTTLQLANAAAAGRWASETWDDWARVKERPEPPSVPVWIDDEFLLNSVKELADEVAADASNEEARGLIVWYDNIAVGEKLSEFCPVFGPGDKASAALAKARPSKAPVIACSRMAHGEGKNLQSYTDELFLVPPADPVGIQQAIGRVLRPGQMVDTVRVYFNLHTEDLVKALLNAYRDAVSLQKNMGEPQFLLTGDCVGSFWNTKFRSKRLGNSAAATGAPA